MKRSKSSPNWMQEHRNDPYVKKAQEAGLRSRSAYKLIELQERDRLIRKRDVVVDLGAAPGGWSQVAIKLVGNEGAVFALDILPMDVIAGVDFIQGDFTEEQSYQTLHNRLEGRQVNVVLSDMAPNMSGIAVSDQAKAMYLVELALDFAQSHLSKGGVFVVKVFQGAGFDEYIKAVRQSFKQVVVRKPKASRPRSKEVYLVAR